MLPNPDLLTAARAVVDHLDTHDTLTAIDAPARQLLRAVLAVDLYAELAADVARLTAERDALTAELAARRAPAAGPAAPATLRHVCPDCGETFKSKGGLSVHHARKHPFGARSQPPAAEPPIRLVDDAPGWRCADCNSDSFTRDLHQPDRCMRCAKKRGSDAA